MARPKQDGLLYFSLDTDFFYADKRIKRLHSRYGNNGLVFYIYLLTEIYRNGYYTRWDAESVEDAMDDLHLAEGFVEQVMAFLISRSLIVKITLANSDTAISEKKEGNERPQCEFLNPESGQERAEFITSPGIQKRYQEAKRGCKRQIEVDSRIWLLKKEETLSCIKVTQNQCNSEKNQCNSEKNQCNSEKKDIKENKVKENKVKEIKAVEKFELFWDAYPMDKNRYLAEKAYCDVVLDGIYSEDDLLSAAKNYAEYCRITGNDKIYHAGNFLKNCVFEDYLPGKYKKTEEKKPKAGFWNFNQREYDYDALEKELLSRCEEN